jgi:hypothetical protein
VVVSEFPLRAVGAVDDDLRRLALLNDDQVGVPTERPFVSTCFLPTLFTPQHDPTASTGEVPERSRLGSTQLLAVGAVARVVADVF